MVVGIAHEAEQLHAATRRLIRAVDALEDAAFGGASLLPGWTRGHVIAHLALNAEGLAGVLRGAAAGSPTPMYESQERRDADIATLAGSGADVVRDRFLASCTTFHAAVLHLPGEAWSGSFERTPGGESFALTAVLPMRRREVEIHHCDLGLGHTAADWPEEFLDAVFNRVVHDRESGPSMLLRTPDGDVVIGPGGGPVVSGSRAALAWWLLGRGSGEGLDAEPELPTLGPWR